jgi:hypothetical protein
MLILCRDEAEPLLSGDRLDRNPPIGPVLSDGGTSRVVRLRLRPVTRRLCASEYAVYEDAGALPGLLLTIKQSVPRPPALMG